MVWIFSVDERLYSVPEGLEFDTQEAREFFIDAVNASQKLELTADRSEKAYRAELFIVEASESESPNSTQEPKNEILRSVHVELILSKWMVGGSSSKIVSQGRAVQKQPLRGMERRESFSLLLEQAINQAVDYLDLQLMTRDVRIEELKNLLSHGNSDERLYVLRALRDRKDAESLVPQVMDMLSDPDPNLAMEAVGVLVSQKDARAVRPLIRMSRRRDQLFLLQIISALGEIKGMEARGYLFTLSAGHVSPIIRERARETLMRVQHDEEEQPPMQNSGASQATLPASKSGG